MALSPRARLGPYEIVSSIGAGGMGEVYRGRDTKLDRDVAIKVLPDTFVSDPERIARFQREAKTLASLNHPHIGAIYGLEESHGIMALVLELVEGPTLADRIAHGPIPLDEALPVARQIAEALEAAHDHGIVHRDLKPANIKLKSDGSAKVLDFGLAKAVEGSSMRADLSASPTITSPAMTIGGVILGTAAYMSPEQAKGRVVDRRADIWAFGCVLYEMLTARRAFEAEDVTETLAAVLRAEPDWSALPSGTPPRIRALLQRCLTRDVKQRLQAIGEARIAIDAPEGDVRPSPAGNRLWAAALVAAVVLAAAGWLRTSAPVGQQPLMRLSAELPGGEDIPGIAGSVLAISPDGMRIAVLGQDATGRRRLSARRLDATEFAPLAGTEEAMYPFFSPDGEWIGFFAEGKLKKVSAQGGSVSTLCDAPEPRGASWGDDGNIIAVLNGGRTGFSRIPSGGGTPAPVASKGLEKGAIPTTPHVLPGSKAVVFTNVGGANPDEATIRVLSFDTGEQKIVQQPGFFGRYVPSGHLIYVRDATLQAAPFDSRTFTVTGPSQPVLEDLRLAGLSAAANLDVSRTGTFVYLVGSEQRSRGLFSFDSTAKQQPVQPAPGYYVTPRFSPNGTRLAFALASGQGRQLDIWIKDLGAGTMLRLTRMPGSNHHPLWMPDGTGLVFESVLGGTPALYWIRSDGGGEPRRLTDDNIRRIPYGISPDGKWLLYGQQSPQVRELGIVPFEKNGDDIRLGQPKTLVRSPALVVGAQFSPDGRWIAYHSDETGINEVYVTPLEGGRSKVPISNGGGRYPLWSRTSRELFFLSAEGHVMVTDYTTDGKTLTATKSRRWSDLRLPRLPSNGYDLSPDGKRFVAILDAGGTSAPESVTVLLNFFDELRRRVPVR